MIVFGKTLCCVSLVLLMSCSGGEEPQSAGTRTGTAVKEPPFALTPEQKEKGEYSFVLKGPVISDTFAYTPSEGSRAFYNQPSQMTRILARDEHNDKNTLMIDFKGNRTGKFLIDGTTAGEVAVVLGIANDDGTMRAAGVLSTAAGGELYISEYKEGGYIAGSFKGVIKVEKKPHDVMGRFRVRMKAQ